MPTTAIGCGLALIMVGIAGYIWGNLDGKGSLTALIPAAFGAVIALLGAFARSSESMRKHMMHAALLVALVGVVVPVYQLLSKGVTFSPANVSRGAMALLCFIFLILGIQSFVSARRSGAV